MIFATTLLPISGYVTAISPPFLLQFNDLIVLTNKSSMNRNHIFGFIHFYTPYPDSSHSSSRALRNRRHQKDELHRDESTTTREAGDLNLSTALWRTNSKAHQCFDVELASGCKAPGLFCKNQLK
jgi:hypothetical protein